MLRQHASTSILLLLWHHVMVKPSSGAATSLDVVLKTLYLHKKGIAPLYQALGIPSQLASLLLHCYTSSKSILILQAAMALGSWLTKSPHCIRHYAVEQFIPSSGLSSWRRIIHIIHSLEQVIASRRLSSRDPVSFISSTTRSCS